jgi:uncharacterized protein (DUF305 family)
MFTRRIAVVATALLASLVLVGCTTTMGGMGMNDDDSGSDTGSSETPAAFNNADVMFAAMMIPHHEQAIEMSNTLLAKSGIDDRIVTLAEQITAAQQPEIELMQGWLDDWDTGMGDMGGMNDGMMSDDDMAALEAASGADAGRIYLQQMIVHHEGAIDMANGILDDGESADVATLARSIVTSQTAEIVTMKEILASL